MRRVHRRVAESDDVEDYPDVDRPHTRGDCKNGPRPCPWVSCRHHLYLEVTPAGSLKLQHPDKELAEMADTCSLDVADRRPHSLGEVGEIVGISKERARQVEELALRRLSSNAMMIGLGTPVRGQP